MKITVDSDYCGRGTACAGHGNGSAAMLSVIQRCLPSLRTTRNHSTVARMAESGSFVVVRWTFIVAHRRQFLSQQGNGLLWHSVPLPWMPTPVAPQIGLHMSGNHSPDL